MIITNKQREVLSSIKTLSELNGHAPTLEEIIERVRKGPLDGATDRVVTLAQRRMTGIAPAQPSKPDDLSVVLFRKTAKPARKPPDEI